MITIAAKRCAGDFVTSIACNAAIYRYLIRDEPLHYYWLHDHLACDLFGDYARYCQQNRGTKIITLARSGPGALAMRGLEQADEFIDASSPDHTVTWQRGKYTNARTSGGLCLQFAVNHGAKNIHIVGIEGYKSTADNIVIDTFDGRLGKDTSNFQAKAYQAPLFKLIADTCPDVQFTFYGKPVAPIEGPNIKWINEKELAQCT